VLVEMLQPYEGRILDPACGSCGMFVQSAKFLRAHAGSGDELAIYGQELNQATWRIGRMNLAIHGLSGNVALTQGGSLLNDAHPTLKADYVIANPPFNQKKWGAAQVAGDSRWKWGEPPDANANYAWIQHFASHLGPNGRAGFVLANGSLTSMQSGEGAIRESRARLRTRRRRPGRARRSRCRRPARSPRTRPRPLPRRGRRRSDPVTA